MARVNIVASLTASMLIVGIFAGCIGSNDEEKSKLPPEPAGDLRLWYGKPASAWLEALPIGNGKMGAMVFGGASQEHLQLNEESVWSGGSEDRTNPLALQSLELVRQLLFNGQYTAADAVAQAGMMSVPLWPDPVNNPLASLRPYQPLGDLWMTFDCDGGSQEYYRGLDLKNSLASVSYKSGGASFQREYFASYPDQVIVIHVSSGKPGAINMQLNFSRAKDAAYEASAPNKLILTGKLDGGSGSDIRAELWAFPTDGTTEAQGDRLIVKGASDAVFLLAGATSYRGADPAAVCQARLQNASAKTYSELKERHTDDYKSLFNTVSIDLGNSKFGSLPTDERLAKWIAGESDTALQAIYFQYGRYLMISGSRPGSLPLNLRGKWNGDMQPSWNSGYTLDINIEMCYWPAEVCNLAECAEPLFDFMDFLREPGNRTAELHYACRGFVVHHCTDIYGFTTPADAVLFGLWPMSPAWMCQHLWEHYLFEKDESFLANEAYPIMKDAALFLLDYLVEDRQGRLVTNPSYSPENGFISTGLQPSWLCVGATMDFELIYDLFTHCIKASEILGIDYEFRGQLQDALARIPGFQIGQYGQLQEWLEDHIELEQGHRHLSHLFAFHPGNQITLRVDPELSKAVRVSIERRLSSGGGWPGWSTAWVASFWARFEEGNMAYDAMNILWRQGTAANMFGMCPTISNTSDMVFVMDSNFGGVAAMAEMLLQSHAGEISLLPALPDAWASGNVSGLRARGGFEVSMSWTGGKLARAEILSNEGGICRIRARGPIAVKIDGHAIPFTQVEDCVIEFNTVSSQTYQIERA